jgi:C-terminal processing protease CtpA/Prc
LGHPRTSSRSNHRSGGTSGTSSSRRMSSSSSRRSRVTVLAPPGKLGIILANKADSKGTVVSGVRTSSALVDKVSPGDRIVAIDGEDVSLMTVSEITSIMARKSDFERTLTVLTSPRHLSSTQLVSSPRASNEYDYKFRN